MVGDDPFDAAALRGAGRRLRVAALDEARAGLEAARAADTDLARALNQRG